jgi:ATP-dependent Lhr-like helicase
VKTVQQWRKFLPRVYDAFFGNRWGLLPSQKIAIPIVLEGKNLLLIAPTGSGKTEAVVAPLAERALDFRGQTYAIYIAPTRALANDLEVRLKERLERCGLRLAIRHGERNTVQGKQPPAFILTTPESLEVMLSVMPDYARERLKEVRAVVVDEVHQFFGTRRGLQLACLLERLKHHAKHPLQRIGLSATVAEPERVARFLQGSDEPVQVVSVKGQRQLQVYISFVGSPKPDDFGDAAAEWLNEILADHRKVLVFANTRATCDWLCWQLSECLPVPVMLHYSSLHRDYREWVEKTFRQAQRAVCVATSTLELGIDIGDIDAVAFWGAPHSVTSFLQRLGRGNRRTDTSIVYAACPQWHPSGALADPDDDLLRFVALTYCALNDEMETRSEPHYYSVLLQQLLALCCRYGRIAPDAFVATISHRPPFCDEKTLVDILDALTERGVLERDVQRDLWLPDDTFHVWQAKGLFWSNIGGQESAIVVGEGKEQPIPLAEIPAQYARGLRPGKIVVLAGKPRLVTRVESQSVWVTDLEHEDAELAKYFAPPEPTPQSVAQAIRTILTMPDEALRELPIFYDDWSRQRLRRWRQHLGERLRDERWVGEWRDMRWVLYTFAGSISNWILSDLMREMTTASVDADAWRISCSQKVPLERILKGLNVSVLERIVEKRWRDYLRRLALPLLFDSLPDHLKQQEVFSVLDLPKVAETLKRFQFALVGGTQNF